MYTSIHDQKQITTTGDFTSNKISRVKLIWSTIVMNLQITKRYKANLVGGLLEMGILVLVFGLFASAMEFKNGGLTQLTSDQIFIFFLGAIVLIVFNGTALRNPVETVQRDLYNGTLEYLFFNPINMYYYMVGNVLGDAIIRFTFLFLPLFSVMLLVINVNLVSMLAILSVSILVLSTIMSLGIVMSITVILWKDVRGIIGILSVLFQFLSGAFFPVQTFPEPIQMLAFLLPFTFGFDLIRYFSFEGQWTTLLPIEIEIALLLVFALFYLVVSAYLLKKIPKHAKSKGLHLI
ncbi:MAG: ABC transporter permease [Candidatus Hodarchaeales archaeon]|jgi:ABC-2 type transport system permease protein